MAIQHSLQFVVGGSWKRNIFNTSQAIGTAFADDARGMLPVKDKYLGSISILNISNDVDEEIKTEETDTFML